MANSNAPSPTHDNNPDTGAEGAAALPAQTAAEPFVHEPLPDPSIFTADQCTEIHQRISTVENHFKTHALTIDYGVNSIDLWREWEDYTSKGCKDIPVPTSTAAGKTHTGWMPPELGWRILSSEDPASVIARLPSVLSDPPRASDQPPEAQDEHINPAQTTITGAILTQQEDDSANRPPIVAPQTLQFGNPPPPTTTLGATQRRPSAWNTYRHGAHQRSRDRSQPRRRDSRSKDVARQDLINTLRGDPHFSHSDTDSSQSRQNTPPADQPLHINRGHPQQPFNIGQGTRGNNGGPLHLGINPPPPGPGHGPPQQNNPAAAPPPGHPPQLINPAAAPPQGRPPQLINPAAAPPPGHPPQLINPAYNLPRRPIPGDQQQAAANRGQDAYLQVLDMVQALTMRMDRNQGGHTRLSQGEAIHLVESAAGPGVAEFLDTRLDRTPRNTEDLSHSTHQRLRISAYNNSIRDIARYHTTLREHIYDLCDGKINTSDFNAYRHRYSHILDDLQPHIDLAKTAAEFDNEQIASKTRKTEQQDYMDMPILYHERDTLPYKLQDLTHALTPGNKLQGQDLKQEWLKIQRFGQAHKWPEAQYTTVLSLWLGKEMATTFNSCSHMGLRTILARLSKAHIGASKSHRLGEMQQFQRKPSETIVQAMSRAESLFERGKAFLSAGSMPYAREEYLKNRLRQSIKPDCMASFSRMFYERSDDGRHLTYDDCLKIAEKAEEESLTPFDYQTAIFKSIDTTEISTSAVPAELHSSRRRHSDSKRPSDGRSRSKESFDRKQKADHRESQHKELRAWKEKTRAPKPLPDTDTRMHYQPAPPYDRGPPNRGSQSRSGSRSSASSRNSTPHRNSRESSQSSPAIPTPQGQYGGFDPKPRGREEWRSGKSHSSYRGNTKPHHNNNHQRSNSQSRFQGHNSGGGKALQTARVVVPNGYRSREIIQLVMSNAARTGGGGLEFKLGDKILSADEIIDLILPPKTSNGRSTSTHIAAAEVEEDDNDSDGDTPELDAAPDAQENA